MFLWLNLVNDEMVNDEIGTVSKFYSRIYGNVCIYRMEQPHVNNYDSYAQWLWYGVNIIKLSQGHIFIKKHVKHFINLHKDMKLNEWTLTLISQAFRAFKEITLKGFTP